MPAAPLIAKKLSAGSSAEAIGMELDRRARVYANEVDRSRSNLNEYWVGGEWVKAGDGARPETLDAAIERRMGELNTKRRIRKDAVKAEGFVLSTNGQLDDERAVEFLKAGVRWMSERYGQENLLAAAIHMDEETPHAQFWISPVIHDDETGLDRLSAKELFTPNKVDRKAKKVIEEGTLTKLQRDFWREVSSGYGFSEPFTAEQRMANGKVYRSQAAYKADRAVQKKNDELKAVENEIKQENERLERVRRAADALESVAERVDAVERAQMGGKSSGFGEVVRACADILGAFVSGLPDGMRALCEAALGKVAEWSAGDAPRSGPEISLGWGGGYSVGGGDALPVVDGGDGPQPQRQKVPGRKL